MVHFQQKNNIINYLKVENYAFERVTNFKCLEETEINARV